MRKIYLFLTALFISIVAILSYLYNTITIYSPAKMTTSLIYSQVQVKDSPALQCYENKQKPALFNQTEFSILVWNIHKGSDKGWQQALQNFANNRDFLLLQEVSNQQNLQALLHFPTWLYVAAFSYYDRESGVKLLSQTEPYYYCAASEQEPWIIIPKVGVAARYLLANGQSLLIVNLHLVNFEWTPTNYRKQLEPMINLIGQHQGPIILAGDFNTWNTGRMQLLKKLTEANNLQEVTFQQDYRLRVFSNPLDHIFVRGLKVKQSSTRQTQSSDHNPLFATFELISPN